MCLQCMTESTYLGEVLPGIGLCLANIDYGDIWKQGQYALVFSDDPFLIFDKPIRDPYTGMSDDEVNSTDLDDLPFYNSLTSFRAKTKLRLMDGYKLVKAAMDTGYCERDEDVASWLHSYLCHYIGNLNEKV